MKGKELNSLIEPLAEGLAVDKDILREYFEVVKTMPAFESIQVKQDATPGDIAWVEVTQSRVSRIARRATTAKTLSGKRFARARGGLRRRDQSGTTQATSLQKTKDLKPGDIIGLSGLEQIYDDYLRGKDGYREVVVDSRGRIQDEIETVAPIPGRDLVTTIDLDLTESRGRSTREFGYETRRADRDGSEQR